MALVGVDVRDEWPDSESVEPYLVTGLFLRRGPSVTSLELLVADWPRFELRELPASEVGSNLGRNTVLLLVVHSPELMRRLRWRLN